MTLNPKPSTLYPNIVIHTDGGSRGNPGPAATGVVILSPTNEIIHSFGHYLGETTNNVAEYSAVIDALNWITSPTSPTFPTSSTLSFKLDSQLVVEQLNRRWKIKDANLFQFATQIWSLIEQHQLSVSFTYVPREQNKQADAEVNKTLDSILK